MPKEFSADLHIHSRFSRATSKQLTVSTLAQWGLCKGIAVLGTGDFTHPQWRKELQQELLFDESTGLYRAKQAPTLPWASAGLQPQQCAWQQEQDPLFMLQGEISSIYKRHGQVRKVHNLVYVPDFTVAERLCAKLESIGNLKADGRPILGLDSKDLLEIVLDTDPRSVVIPAHVWTPWFSLFGSRSGFDSMEECFGDLAGEIFALETGLSSDPAMNRLWSHLDAYSFISNSDAHSPANLGREANRFCGIPSYDGIFAALRRKPQSSCAAVGTIEFFPEEGKYHLDGHRNCHVCCEPEDSKRYGNRCPVCGKPLTIGVLNRVMSLADRKEPQLQAHDAFASLIPLAELCGECLGVGTQSKKAQALYTEVIRTVGPELDVLLKASIASIEHCHGLLGEAIARMRRGEVIRNGGYDGQYGVVRVFKPEELKKNTASGLWLLEQAATPPPDAGSVRHILAQHPPQCAIHSPQAASPALRQDNLYAQPSEPSVSTDDTCPRLPHAQGGTGRKKTLPLSAAQCESLKPQYDASTNFGITQEDAADAGTTEARATAVAGHIGGNLLGAGEQGNASTDVHGVRATQTQKYSDEQQRVIEHQGGACLVLAGPGTGKTHTLMGRVAYLRTQGVAAEDICVLTFTRRAAQELRNRLAHFDGMHALRCDTLHALALGTLREQLHCQQQSVTKHCADAASAQASAPQEPMLLGEDGAYALFTLANADLSTRQCRKAWEICQKARETCQSLPAEYVACAAAYTQHKEKAFCWDYTDILEKYAAYLTAKTSLPSIADTLPDGSPSKVAFAGVAVTDGARTSTASIKADPAKEAFHATSPLGASHLAGVPFAVASAVHARALSRRQAEQQQSAKGHCVHILVDEVQDLSPLQWRCVELLAGDGQGFFGIGDPNQAIYGFRGARKNAAQFATQLWPHLTIHALTQSWRNAPHILQCAQELAPQDAVRLRSVSQASMEQSAAKRVILCETPNAVAEAQWIAHTVAVLLGGTSHREHDAQRPDTVLAPSDIAILVRTKAQMPVIGNALARAGVPYALPETEGFWHEPLIQQVLQAAVLRHGTQLHHKAQAEVMSALCNAPQEKWEGGPQSLRHCLPVELARTVAHSKAWRAMEQQWRECGSWHALLRYVAFMQDAECVRAKAERVQVMTLHASKGLEFYAICIAGLEDGVLPYDTALWQIREGTARSVQHQPADTQTQIAEAQVVANHIAETQIASTCIAETQITGKQVADTQAQIAEAQEEERRLLYVGITRASDLAYISYARSRTRQGREVHLAPSPFLRCIARHCTQRFVRGVRSVKAVQLGLLPG